MAPLAEGGLAHAAFVIDASSRLIPDWKVAGHLRASLALDALEIAVSARHRAGLQVVGMIHHSDHGNHGRYLAIRYTTSGRNARGPIPPPNQPVKSGSAGCLPGRSRHSRATRRLGEPRPPRTAINSTSPGARNADYSSGNAVADSGNDSLVLSIRELRASGCHKNLGRPGTAARAGRGGGPGQLDGLTAASARPVRSRPIGAGTSRACTDPPCVGSAPRGRDRRGRAPTGR